MTGELWIPAWNGQYIRWLLAVCCGVGTVYQRNTCWKRHGHTICYYAGWQTMTAAIYSRQKNSSNLQHKRGYIYIHTQKAEKRFWSEESPESWENKSHGGTGEKLWLLKSILQKQRGTQLLTSRGQTSGAPKQTISARFWSGHVNYSHLMSHSLKSQKGEIPVHISFLCLFFKALQTYWLISESII